jgi:hypothetical protein
VQFDPTPPWRKQEPRVLQKYLMQIFCYTLIGWGLTCALFAFAMFFSLSQGLTPADRVQTDIAIALVCVVLTFVLGGTGLFLLPKVRIPSRFQPSYGYIAPETRDEPFEVRFYRYFWSRSLVGKGAIRFAPEGLVTVGKLEPPLVVQSLAIILIVIIWNISIIARVVAFLLTIVLFVLLRKRQQALISYSQLELIELNGRIVAFRSAQKPHQIAFVVAASDGERLYKELQNYFPSKLLEQTS